MPRVMAAQPRSNLGPNGCRPRQHRKTRRSRAHNKIAEAAGGLVFLRLGFGFCFKFFSFLGQL